MPSISLQNPPLTTSFQKTPPEFAGTKRIYPPVTKQPPSETDELVITRTMIEEEGIKILRYFDTIFVIDDSLSMRLPIDKEDKDCRGFMENSGALTRWQSTGVALSAIARRCVAYDEDGIDVYFLNHEAYYPNVTGKETIMDIFGKLKPESSTPLTERLQDILLPYLDYYEARRKQHGKKHGVKPLNLIVLTDGAPNDKPTVKNLIIQTMARLDKQKALPHQVGIQLFQVGIDEVASAWLSKLDNELQEKKNTETSRDIVDTTTFDATEGNWPELTDKGILKAVLGGINKLVDEANISPWYEPS